MFDRLRDAGFEVEFTSHAEAILLHDFTSSLTRSRARSSISRCR